MVNALIDTKKRKAVRDAMDKGRFSGIMDIGKPVKSKKAHETTTKRSVKIVPEEMQKLNSALLEASRNGKKDEIKRLLKAGADVDAKNGCGETALMKAASEGDFGAVELLLKKGADVRAIDDEGKTALRTAVDTYCERADGVMRGHCMRFRSDIENINRDNTIALLIAYGADVDTKRSDGTTPLMAAANYGIEAICKLLVLNKADVNAIDNNGLSVIDHAKKGQRMARTELHNPRAEHLDEACGKVIALLRQNGAK